jgi:hypothetical protein
MKAEGRDNSSYTMRFNEREGATRFRSVTVTTGISRERSSRNRRAEHNESEAQDAEEYTCASTPTKGLDPAGLLQLVIPIPVENGCGAAKQAEGARYAADEDVRANHLLDPPIAMHARPLCSTCDNATRGQPLPW